MIVLKNRYRIKSNGMMGNIRLSAGLMESLYLEAEVDMETGEVKLFINENDLERLKKIEDRDPRNNY